MAGVAPLSYQEIESWMRLTQIVLAPHEVNALILIDAALRQPDEEKKEVDSEESRLAEKERSQGHAWPTRKREPVLLIEE